MEILCRAALFKQYLAIVIFGINSFLFPEYTGGNGWNSDRYGMIIFMVWLWINRTSKTLDMNKLIRGLIAGYGAKKLGGGCLSTILIFIIIYYALGQCN